VPQLQPGKVRVGLVGEEHLEAVPVVVAEAQLGTGMGVLSAADRPCTRWPGVQVEPAGQLAHLGAIAGLAVGVDRWGPALLRLGPDGLAEVGVDRHPKGEPDLGVAEVPGEPGAGPGAVAADQDRLLSRGCWELGEGEVDQLDQIVGAAGGGVAWSQQAGSGSPGAWPRSR
jgi:hypothetical protein